MKEFKTIPQFVSDIDDRTVSGICAVFGNVDYGGDRLHAGAFAKTLQEGKTRIKFLWNHGADGYDIFVTPPIAVIKSIREVGRENLPKKVLEYAPQATGGLEVKREYLRTERATEVLEAIRAGVDLEMSFGYDAIKFDWSKEDIEGKSVDVRELREVRLWDVSDVNYGMNPATVGAKGAELIYERVRALVEEVRSGKTASAELLKRLRDEIARAELDPMEEPKESRAAEVDPALTRWKAIAEKLEAWI